MSNHSMRDYMIAMAQYLGVKDGEPMMESIKKASNSLLPKMFVDLTEAIAEVTGDKDILKTIKVRMPDGSIVTLMEAKAQADKIKANIKPTGEPKYEVPLTGTISTKTVKRSTSGRPR